MNGTQNIICGAKIYKHLMAGCPNKSGKQSCPWIAGDSLKAIAAYNSGPYKGCTKTACNASVATYAKANWKDLIPSETKDYIVKLPNFQQQIASNNGCSVDALGSNCESFNYTDGYGGVVLFTDSFMVKAVLKCQTLILHMNVILLSTQTALKGVSSVICLRPSLMPLLKLHVNVIKYSLTV